MIERIGESLEFRAQYIASKLGATGLTVTVDLWGPAHTEIVTGGSATEMGDGLYYYVLSSGSVTAAGLYTIVFKTASASVDQQHLAANFTIGPDWVENIDAAISSRSTLTAQQVWEYATRTLSSFGTLAADVWTYATRTLTQAAASVVAAVTGTSITVYRGTTWSISLTGLGDLSAYDTVYFSVKEGLNDSDDNAILRVKNVASGLERINKAAPTSATNGTITIDDAAAGDITITVQEAETQNMPLFTNYHYDVKGIDNNGSVDLKSVGVNKFTVSGDVTRKIT